MVVADQIPRAILQALIQVVDRDLTGEDHVPLDAVDAFGVAELSVGTVVDAEALLVATALTGRWILGDAMITFGVTDLPVWATIDAGHVRTEPAEIANVIVDAGIAVWITDLAVWAVLNTLLFSVFLAFGNDLVVDAFLAFGIADFTEAAIVDADLIRPRISHLTGAGLIGLPDAAIAVIIAALTHRAIIDADWP